MKKSDDSFGAYSASRSQQFIDKLLSDDAISDETLDVISEFLQELSLEFDSRTYYRLKKYFDKKNKERLPPSFLEDENF